MKKATTAMELPVVGIKECAKIGAVQNIVVGSKDMKVVYFVMGENTLLKISEIVGVGDDYIVIKSKSAVHKVFENREIAESMENSLSPIGIMAVSDTGNDLGRVQDFEFDEKTGVIGSIILEDGQTESGEKLLSMSKDFVFVGDTIFTEDAVDEKYAEIDETEEYAAGAAASDDAADAQAEEAAEIDETEEYLIGKVLFDDVESADGDFMAVQGTVIDRTIINNAKAHNALIDLTLNVD